MKFIISIFLLILCILISQSVDYYLHQSIIEGFPNFRFHLKLPIFGLNARHSPQNTPQKTPPTPPPNTPNFIVKYISNIKTNNYLTDTEIQKIYTAVAYANKYANNVPAIKTKQNLLDYLSLLKAQLNGTSPPLAQLIFFSISLPAAFELFFFPDDEIPVPYNKLNATMGDIFPNSVPYTQIQIMCILWQQSMVLFTPSGPIIDPRNDTFQKIISGYISKINTSIDALQTFYSSSSIHQ
jgi:hypothetical protein